MALGLLFAFLCERRDRISRTEIRIRVCKWEHTMHEHTVNGIGQHIDENIWLPWIPIFVFAEVACKSFWT